MRQDGKGNIKRKGTPPKTVKNDSDLMSALSFYARHTVARVADATADKLVRETEDRVYGDEPRQYKRTYEFSDSIDIDFDYGVAGYDKYSASVFFNPNKMNVGMGSYKYMSADGRTRTVYYGIHANSKGEDVRKHLVKWLNDGHKKSSPRVYNPKGDSIGRHRYQRRKGAKMLEATERWLERKLPNIAKSALSEYKVSLDPKY